MYTLKVFKCAEKKVDALEDENCQQIVYISLMKLTVRRKLARIIR